MASESESTTDITDGVATEQGNGGSEHGAPPSLPAYIAYQAIQSRPLSPQITRRQMGWAFAGLALIVGVLLVIGSIGEAVKGRNPSDSLSQRLTYATSTPNTIVTPLPTDTPAPTATPSATVTPTPSPTATPVPKWVTMKHYTGASNTQTETFHLSEGMRINWTANVTYQANLCMIKIIDSSSGMTLDYLCDFANASNQSSTYYVHYDGDVYLHIEVDSVSYSIDVQRFQ